MRPDLYSILEVSPKATEEVIHAAYRVLAKQCKDDQNQLRAINDAKDILLDPVKRIDYDKSKAKGKIIGNYRIIAEIAEGGFGRTYKGEHTSLGTPVCLKHASKISPQDEQLLMEEAKAIWDLRHYSIPSIRDILKMDDGSLVLVMSFIPGPTLQQAIEKTTRLDPENVAWIAERVLNALKYIHFHGVVHGDMKPSNIIVQPDSHQVSIVDFGLSMIRPSRSDQAKGYTPHFAAPEQINCETLLPETDFFGLGMSMIAALGGNINARQVPDKTPNGLCGFIKKLIRHDISARPNWQKEDLCKTIQEIRAKDFGRTSSGMKSLDI